jgi:hypothetical protein
MFRTTPKFAHWQTPEQRAFTARQVEKRDAMRRAQCNMLKFWRMCTKPRCRRNHTCSEDMHACFERHWAMIAEEDKQWIRGAIRAAARGATKDEVARAADAARAAFLESLAARSVPVAAPASSPVANDTQTAPPADVRIRRL